MPDDHQCPQPIGDRTFAFAVRAISLCRLLCEKPGVTRTLANQLLRAATSIGANVEEGQAAQSRADFINKYSIALKETRETRYWLRLLQAAELADAETLGALLREITEIGNILGAGIRTAKRNA